MLMTHQLPDALREIAMQGEFDEFDLNEFFSADGIGDKAKFKYERKLSSCFLGGVVLWGFGVFYSLRIVSRLVMWANSSSPTFALWE